MLALHPTVLPRQGIEPQAQTFNKEVPKMGGMSPRGEMQGGCKFVTRDWRVEGSVKLISHNNIAKKQRYFILILIFAVVCSISSYAPSCQVTKDGNASMKWTKFKVCKNSSIYSV